MSYGWRWCKICKCYEKWQEYADNDLIECGHHAVNDTDTENHIDFHTDDSYYEYFEKIHPGKNPYSHKLYDNPDREI